MKSSSKSHEEHGLVAILDALGAKQFGSKEVKRFIDARKQVVELLHQKAEDLLGDSTPPRLRATSVSTFTFNDTIVITFRSGKKAPKLREISAFLLVIRKFVVDSLAHGILFRGVISIGKFYTNEETNTVMGEAVSDAASWYEEANWIGVHCTPRCSLTIDALLERAQKTKPLIMVDYDVPLKADKKRRLKAVNWPRVFLLPSLNPWHSKTLPRAKLLKLLTRHRIPMGVEEKYENTVAFFDFCMKTMGDKGAVENPGPTLD